MRITKSNRVLLRNNPYDTWLPRTGRHQRKRRQHTLDEVIRLTGLTRDEIAEATPETFCGEWHNTPYGSIRIVTIRDVLDPSRRVIPRQATALFGAATKSTNQGAKK